MRFSFIFYNKIIIKSTGYNIVISINWASCIVSYNDLFSPPDFFDK